LKILILSGSGLQIQTSGTAWNIRRVWKRLAMMRGRFLVSGMAFAMMRDRCAAVQRQIAGMRGEIT